MKKLIIVFTGILICFFSNVNAQDLMPNEVPTVILQNFNTQFPGAADVEWEKKGDLYEVDFEIGIPKLDFEVRYRADGKVIYQKEEITNKELPSNIHSVIKKDFKEYRIDGLKKITENKVITFVVELDSKSTDWKITFDSQGKILNKIAD